MKALCWPRICWHIMICQHIDGSMYIFLIYRFGYCCWPWSNIPRCLPTACAERLESPKPEMSFQFVFRLNEPEQKVCFVQTTSPYPRRADTVSAVASELAAALCKKFLDDTCSHFCCWWFSREIAASWIARCNTEVLPVNSISKNCGLTQPYGWTGWGFNSGQDCVEPMWWYYDSMTIWCITWLW